jgi:hypothetical protein
MTSRLQLLAGSGVGALLVSASYGFLLVTSSDARTYIGKPSAVALWLAPFALSLLIVLACDRRSRNLRRASGIASLALLLAACVLSAWRVWYAGRWGGDMQGLFVLAESVALSAGVLVTWVAAYVVLRVRGNSGA